MSVAANALATLEEVKLFYGMVGSKQADDDLLEDLIDRMTQQFETYCGVNSFKVTDYTEYIDGQSSKYIFPQNPPIVSITSINDDSDWTWDSSTLIDAADYRIVDSRYVVYNSKFGSGDQNIQMVYRGGYSTIPLDLKQSCIEEVTKRYKHRRDIDMTDKTLDDGSASYTETAFLPQTLEVLYKYKLMWIQ
jgi:hypothetical protein